jgi:hypothetical protein
MTNMVPSSTICYQQIAAWLKMTDQYDHGTDRYDHGTCVLALEDAEVDISSQDCHCKTSSQIMFLFSHHYQYKAKHPVRLNLSARICQPFSSVFLSQQISISRSAVLLQPAKQGERNAGLPSSYLNSIFSTQSKI